MQFIFWPKGCIEDSPEATLLIEAQNFPEAKEKHKRYSLKNDQTFLESCYLGGVNFGYAEYFWISNEEETQRFYENPDDIITLDEFKSRVKQFFSDNPEWAHIFLANYEISYSRNIDFLNPDLSPFIPMPEEMANFLWEHFESTRWESNFSYLVVSDLKQI